MISGMIGSDIYNLFSAEKLFLNTYIQFYVALLKTTSTKLIESPY